MQITVTIPDDFAAQVRAHGLTPEGYVEGLIAEQVRTQPFAEEIVDRLADLELFFREMSVHSDKVPALPEEAFTRESIYQDHD